MMTEKGRRIVPIFRINVDSTVRSRALIRILSLVRLKASRKTVMAAFVVTPNPEILVRGLADPAFARILNGADLSLPDGIGVVAAAKYLSLPTTRRFGLMPFDLVFQGFRVGLSLIFNRDWVLQESQVVPGRVIFKELLEMAAKRGLRVFMLGGKPAVAAKVARRIMNNELGVGAGKLVQTDSGPWLDKNGKPVNKEQSRVEREVIQKINVFKPQLLFVAFGPPKQEKWVARHLPQLKVGVAMVVGGAFDYYAGEAPMPPKFMEKAGFEWLWRLATQPWRLPRVFTAVIVFPWKVFLWKLRRLWSK